MCMLDGSCLSLISEQRHISSDSGKDKTAPEELQIDKGLFVLDTPEVCHNDSNPS